MHLTWIQVALISLAGAAVIVTLFNHFIVRPLARRLFETQVSLYKLVSAFQKALSENPTAISRYAMSVEGKAVEILEADGRDIVRFSEDVSDEERERILDYLKHEGFIS